MTAQHRTFERDGELWVINPDGSVERLAEEQQIQGADDSERTATRNDLSSVVDGAPAVIPEEAGTFFLYCAAVGHAFVGSGDRCVRCAVQEKTIVFQPHMIFVSEETK